MAASYQHSEPHSTPRHMFVIRSTMTPPPYDRALVLASLVQTMRDHYLAVGCGCGTRRVIALARMAEDRRVRGYTLAHVAMSLKCRGCLDGPDEVHLTATVYGLWPPSFGGDTVWTISLVERGGGGAKRLRFVNDIVGEERTVDQMPMPGDDP